MDTLFQFYMPTKVCFENGAAFNAEKLVVGERVLIIADPFLFKSGIAEKIGNSLVGKTVAYFSDIEPNPTCESVDAATKAGRDINADCVIGIGGGSSLDVSKIVACLLSNEGSIYDYYGGGAKVITQRKAQLICVPTTAGTGSEVTNVGVFTNKKTGKKVPMLSQFFWPDIALIDGTLTYSLPPAITASTGLDAFCHAIEAYWNKGSQPICDMLALKAMKLVVDNIQTAYKNPDDTNARANMSLASVLAGIAFSQTRTTGIHAVSFPLTVNFGMSHGAACAITLPAFIRISVEKASEKMEELSRYLGFTNVEELADGVESMMKNMKMQVRLNEVGVKESDIEKIAETGLENAIVHLTPALMNQETLSKLLHSIL